jgi:prolyl-tRNA synthetase
MLEALRRLVEPLLIGLAHLFSKRGAGELALDELDELRVSGDRSDALEAAPPRVVVELGLDRAVEEDPLHARRQVRRALERELVAASFAHEPLRVKIDTRDMRGGDKVWQHVKQGVPLRVEIGPRDIAAGAVSVCRRDRGPKERASMPLAEFVADAPGLLEELQRGMFERAKAFREQRSVRLSTQAELLEFFAETADKGAGAHGGFAFVHVADDPAVLAVLDPLKVTVRCIPMDGEDEPGTCIITGQQVRRRSLLARSY